MNRTFLVFLSLVYALPCGFAAPGQHAHGSSSSSQAELGASAAYDAHGGLWVVHRVSGHVAVSRSADDGQTWSSPVLVTRSPEPIDTGGDARPKIALGPKGEVYVTWTKPLAEPYTGEIRFARSLDEGRMFSEPIVVHHDRQVITHRFDTLAVDREGRVFVAWIDKRDVMAAGEGKYAGAALYFAVSDDRGASFRGDFKVADHSCECCRVALVARPDGGVTAFWRHIFEPNIRDHGVATLSADGHATPVQRATFDDWRLDACPHHGPAVAVDGSGALHGVWFTAASGRRGAFYGRIEGGTSGGVTALSADAAAHASIAAEGRLVAIAWKEAQDGRTRLRGRLSHDAGQSWTACDLGAAEGASDHPCVLVHAGRAVVLWNSAEHPLAVLRFPEPAAP